MAGDTPWTPGPWAYEDREMLDPDDIQRPWIGRLDEQCFTALAFGKTLDEVFANARLIASAPEMVELLREALGVFGEVRMALAAISDSAVEAGFDQLGNIIDDRLVNVNAVTAKIDTLLSKIGGQP